MGIVADNYLKTFIQEFKKLKREKIIIGVSPIHHTSFRNIIEQNFSKEQIQIFDLDNSLQKIIITDNQKQIKYDLIIVTHLWGKQLELSELENIKSINTLVIEDVVLGGKFNNKYANSADLLFHSCGMDKRPASIFGGFVDIKNKHRTLINNIQSSINSLPIPTKQEQYKKIVDVTFLNALYNYRCIQNIIKLGIYFINGSIYNITQKIRKQKPGFEHNNFMKKPTKCMLNRMLAIHNTETITEDILINKYKIFLKQFTKKEICDLFPWHYNLKPTNLPYTLIFIPLKYQKTFILFFDEKIISTIKNPTYKTFENANNKITSLLDNIFYLPSLYALTTKEIIQLTKYIKNYLRLHPRYFKSFKK